MISRIIKRLFDFLASFIGLIILSPVFLIIIVLISFDSKGSPFFLQKRLGLHGKEFKIIKFRTMVINAENIGDGLIIKSGNDPRVTKIGDFLRKTSLDEIPQLINVLKGDMSLVGPRPPVTYHPYNGIDNYPEWAKKRFQMKPGITGLAQIKVRNSVSWDERIIIDNEYVDNYSILLDFRILFITFYVSVFRKNIYKEK